VGQFFLHYGTLLPRAPSLPGIASSLVSWPNQVGEGLSSFADIFVFKSCRRYGLLEVALRRRGKTSMKGNAMNWDQVAGNWKQLRGGIREQWGKLTDDDLDVIAGQRDQLVGKLQERYGWAREEAERQADAFIKKTKAAGAGR